MAQVATALQLIKYVFANDIISRLSVHATPSPHKLTNAMGCGSTVAMIGVNKFSLNK